jgi:hypothetical protein
LSLAGCAATGATGQIDYAGTAALGDFHRSVGVAYCRAQIDSASSISGFFALDSRRLRFGHARGSLGFAGALSPAPDASAKETIILATESGLSRVFTADQCASFDIRKWIDPERRLHVSIVLDCKTDDLQVRGSVESSACDYVAP